MEGSTNNDINFPNWLPLELKTYISNHRKEISTIFNWPGDDIARTIVRIKEKWNIQNRLLKDPRMERVWSLFKKLPKEIQLKCMIRFLETMTDAYEDALKLRRDPGEDKRIKKLRKEVQNLTDALSRANKEIYELSSNQGKSLIYLDCDLIHPYEKQIVEIKNGLLKQLKIIGSAKLSVYNDGRILRVHSALSNQGYEELLTIGKRGQSNFVEIYTREVASSLFMDLFKQPENRLANTVSLVLSEIKDPQNTTRIKKADQTRGRRKTNEYRKKNESLRFPPKEHLSQNSSSNVPPPEPNSFDLS